MTSPDKDVAAIEARLTAATPGPWELEYDSDIFADEDYREWISAINIGGHTMTEVCEILPADLELMAAAPADIAALLAENNRLRERIADARDECDPGENGNILAALSGEWDTDD